MEFITENVENVEVSEAAEPVTPETSEYKKLIFSQKDVDEFIQKRLEKQKERSQKAMDEKEAELETARSRIAELEKSISDKAAAEELAVQKKAISDAFNVPEHLLTETTPEAMEQQAAALREYWIECHPYPNVKDGGEALIPAHKPSGAEQFAKFFEEAIAVGGGGTWRI